MSKFHPAVQHVIDLFVYDHLPENLQRVSRPIAELANLMAEQLDSGPELTVGLRKLLEAKDALVRQAVIDARPAQVVSDDDA